jgi:glutamate dehydrogenase
VAQTLSLFYEAQRRGGFYLDIGEQDDGSGETRVSIGVGNPPQRDFLLQLLEVFHRLDIAINRAY